MATNLKIKIQKSYIYVELFGTRTKGNEVVEEIDLLNQIYKVCQHEKIFKVLALTKIRGRMPITGIFIIMETISKFSDHQKFQISIIAPDSLQFANLELFERASRRFGSNVNVFKKRIDAKRWLDYQ